MRCPAWIRTVAVLTLLLATWTTPASARQWYLETQVGRVRPDFAPVGEPEGLLEGLRNVLVGARYEHAAGGIRLSVGVPTRSGEPVWGAVGGWHRVTPLEREIWFAGVDLSGNGYLMRDRRPRMEEVPGLPGTTGQTGGMTGHALAAHLLPVVGYQTARFQVQIRSGASFYTSRLASQERDRTVWLTEAQSMFAPASWLGIGPVLRHYRTRQDASTYTGGSGIVTHGPVSAWAGAGHWVDMPGSGVPWVVGATIRPHPRVAVNASRRREAFDPLYLREPQTSWSVGLSIRIGEPRATARALPVARFDDGRVTIRVAAADCPPTPRIAGDFNGWEPQPMLRAGDYWVFTAALPPGVYNYAFVDADGGWFVPDTVPGRRDDGMGGYVAVLVVQS